MYSFLFIFILLHIFLFNISISRCFLQKNEYINLKFQNYPFKWSLYATKSKLKGARQFTRDRPKKTRPSAIYPSPTIYYGNVHNHFGAPPEYLAIPVDKTLNILRNGTLSELLSLMKKGITGTELSEVLSDKTFFNKLSVEVESIKEISEYEDCDVSSDLYLYFDRILKSPEQYDHYIDKFYTIKKLQEYWDKREKLFYNTMLNKLFSRLRGIAYKLNDSGIPLNEFTDPKLWHKYGVFKLISNCKMVDNYLYKHKIALNFDIKSLYYIDPLTNEIKSNFHKYYLQLNNSTDKTDTVPDSDQSNDKFASSGSNDCSDINSGKQNPYELYSDNPPISQLPIKLDERGRLPSNVIDKMIDDLTNLGVFDPKDPSLINLSRIDEMMEQFSTENSQHAYAIRDFYLSFRYPDYKIESDPYVLESYLNHNYRTKTYERDLLKKYKNWLRIGAPRESIKPMNLKYEHLAIWHGLSKNRRRKLAQRYVKTLTIPINS